MATDERTQEQIADMEDARIDRAFHEAAYQWAKERQAHYQDLADAALGAREMDAYGENTKLALAARILKEQQRTAAEEADARYVEAEWRHVPPMPAPVE